ncbi:MAG: ribbon-helix-helix domain-containing protein [Janthinobacterium lividum]
MQVAIPPAFEVFAREQVTAGGFASAEDVVLRALEAYLENVADLRSAVEEGFASLDRGEGVDGRSFMRDLIAETTARSE